MLAVPDIELYTAPYCPYCHRAAALLKSKGVAVREIDVTERPELRVWLREATGRTTIPQTFVDGRSLGGYDDLAALDRRGELDAILGLAAVST
jgi:glutaredoxin 3